MAMTQEQFEQMMSVLAAGLKRDSGDGSHKTLRTKDMKCDNFNGEPDKWEDFAFVLRNNIQQENPKAFIHLKEAEAAAGDIDEDRATENEAWKVPEMVIFSGSLYIALSQFCRGDALDLWQR